MISNDILKKKILDSAIHGKLVKNNEKLNPIEVDGIINDVPYKIPSNWKWISFKKGFELKQGTQIDLEKQSMIQTDEMPLQFLRIIDFTQKNNDIRFVSKKYLDYWINENDVAMVRYGTPGFVCYGKSGVLANNLFKIIPKIKINNNFLYYLLKTDLVQNKIVSHSVALSAIKFSDIYKLVVPIPPLEEQNNIVSRVKELFYLIDKKEKNDKEIEKIKEILKDRIVNKYCTTKEDSVLLQDISSVISKGTTPRGGNVCYEDDGVLFLRAENLGYGYNNLLNKKYVDSETHNGFLKRSILEENDILVSIAGALGRTSFVEKEMLPCNCNQAVAFVRIKKGIEFVPKYICYCIMSRDVQGSLLSQVKKTAQPNLTLEHIKNIKISLPSLEEQKKIVDKIESLFELIEQL